MLELELLRKEGMPISWRTLYVGWNRGFVTSDQLPRFAMDRIGYSNPADEALVAELAFTDDRDWWTLQRCMETLSERDRSSNEDALRFWKWAVIKNEVEKIEGRPRHPEWYDEAAETMFDLQPLWAEFPRLPGSDNECGFLKEWIDEQGDKRIVEIVTQGRIWLSVERMDIAGACTGLSSIAWKWLG
jgi:hypothetical protein